MRNRDMAAEREKIEAELQPLESLVARIKHVMEEVQEIERNLRAREAAMGLPASYRFKPLAERMAQLGMSNAAIAQVRMLIEALGALRDRREIPEAAKRLLAGVADAEYSVIDQLAALVERSRRRA